jgi:predicted RNA binding protein YcfA (HicA-like mRNA interferase family)
MSKLPSASARDVIRVAKKLGFVLDHQKGSHAVYLWAIDRHRLVIAVHKGGDISRR